MSTIHPRIRRAESRDLPQILPLLSELGYPCTLAELRLRFERCGLHPGYGVAVAEDAGQLIGLIAWSQTPLFLSEGLRFHIEALVVGSNHRGQGIGKQLVEYVEAIARNNLPAWVDLTSALKRAADGSHTFYKKLGYCNEGTAEKVYLRKNL